MITPADKSPHNDVQPIRTGTFLDRLSGIGGLPRKRITEVFGDAGLGKSTVLLQSVAHAQKSGARVLWADVEFSFDNRYAEGLGVDSSKLDLLQQQFAEDILDEIERAIKDYDLIVLDSIGGLLPRTEAEKGSGEKTIGGQAGLVARFCRKVVPLLALNNCALVVINHSFTDIMSGAVKTSGGAKLEYHKSLSIRLRKSNKVIKKGEKVIGKVVIGQVKKNKLAGTEGLEVESNLLFGEGFSAQEDTLAEAIERGIFTKDGNTYSFAGERIGMISKLREWMKDEANAAKVKEML